MSNDELNRNDLELIDWWDELTDSQKQLIMKGLDNFKSGNVVSSSQFWDKLKNG